MKHCEGCDTKEAQFPIDEPIWCSECWAKEPAHQIDDYLEDRQWPDDFSRDTDKFRAWEDEGGRSDGQM